MLAIVADLLGIFTLASGMALIAPAIIVAIFLRRFGFWFWMFIVAHAFFSAIYFDFDLFSRERAPLNVFYLAKYTAIYLGSVIQDTTTTPALVAGSIGLLMFLLFSSIAAYKAIFQHRSLRESEAVAISFAAFPICTAILTGVGRGTAGYFGSALESRYSTMSIAFLAAVGVFAFLCCKSIRREKLVALTWSTLILSAIILLTRSNLAEINLAKWFTRTAEIDNATFAIKSGVNNAGVREKLFPRPSYIAEPLNTLVKHELGPFSKLVHYYEPPPALFMDTRYATCSDMVLDVVQNLGNGAISVRVAQPRLSQGSWLIAFNRDGNMLGYQKADVPSPEGNPDLFLNVGTFSPAVSAQVVLSQPGHPTCRLDKMLTVSEIEINVIDPDLTKGGQQFAPNVVISGTLGAHEGGLPFGVPPGPGLAWGTYGLAANADQGSIEMRVPIDSGEKRRLAVPIVSGPGRSGISMTAATPTTTAVTSIITRNPHIWREAVIPSEMVKSARGTALTITLSDTGTGPGEWLAASVPYWLD